MIPGLSLVAVNYRTPGDLGAFLRSLDRHPPTQPWMATVVNVCPRDDDTKVAQAWIDKHPDCALEEHEENVGYARAANRARLGPYDTVAVFNADIELSEGALDECADALRANPTWAVLGPRQVDSRGALTHGGVFGPPERPRLRGWQSGMVGAHTDVRDDCLSVSGAAYFVKREVWDALTGCPIYQRMTPGAQGPLLETNLFYEELACSRHAAAHGYRIAFAGTTTIRHEWHGAVKANGVHIAPLMKASLEMYRQFCRMHGLAHE